MKKGELSPYLDMASVATVGHTVGGTVEREMGSGTKFINGDTLLARITPCLENGKSAFVDFLSEGQTGWGSTEFVVLRPHAPLTPYHGYLLTRHTSFREFAIRSMSGTSGRQRVQNDVLGQFLIAVPSDSVAKAFADIVDVIQRSISANDGNAQKPNIGLLDDEFLAQVKSLPERNLAVELLERLLQGEIKSRFSSNIVQEKKFSDLLTGVIQRYQNRAIETAQVMEELIEMAKKFREAARRGESLGLNDDELKFYDALANNESAVRELNDEILKKIAHELTENLRRSLKVDWAERESVRASLRLMVRRILRKYKYPPDQQEGGLYIILCKRTIGRKLSPCPEPQ
ncbi:ribosomal protein L17 [Herbaspirillum seropedicae]|nr:ribosomal protein L17 [Herbaspirillum seropedicae]